MCNTLCDTELSLHPLPFSSLLGPAHLSSTSDGKHIIYLSLFPPKLVSAPKEKYQGIWSDKKFNYGSGGKI